MKFIWEPVLKYKLNKVYVNYSQKHNIKCDLMFSQWDLVLKHN